MARFGLQLPNFTLGGEAGELFPRFLRLATAGEEAGFASLWVMDHLYQLPDLGGADQPMLEAYTLLGALAACTERAELGTLVTGVTYRNPAMLAKQLTTLDVISGGKSKPNATCSTSCHAAPMPSTARPPEITSRVVSCLASSAGLR